MDLLESYPEVVLPPALVWVCLLRLSACHLMFDFFLNDVLSWMSKLVFSLAELCRVGFFFCIISTSVKNARILFHSTFNSSSGLAASVSELLFSWVILSSGQFVISPFIQSASGVLSFVIGKPLC